MSAKQTVDSLVLNGLGAKLDGLSLTGPEKAVLDAIMARAASAGDDVEGFGVVYEIEVTDRGTGAELAALTDPGRRLGNALGFHIHVNPYIGETEKRFRC